MPITHNRKKPFAYSDSTNEDDRENKKVKKVANAITMLERFLLNNEIERFNEDILCYHKIKFLPLSLPSFEAQTFENEGLMAILGILIMLLFLFYQKKINFALL
jgi:hypothetical protein